MHAGWGWAHAGGAWEVWEGLGLILEHAGWSRRALFWLRRMRNRKVGGFMKVFTDAYNLAVGAVVAVLSAIFGVYWYIFAGYFALNVFDWLTGWYRSRKRKRESSSAGLRGILKKTGYWVVVAVAFLVSHVLVHLGNDVLHMDLGFLMMVGWFTLACLMVNEARSILENLVGCGYDVPAVLVDGLKVADKTLNKDVEED